MSHDEIQTILQDIRSKCANIEKMFGFIHDDVEFFLLPDGASE
jgi:hypothetical protein